jgi:hypothetical protein
MSDALPGRTLAVLTTCTMCWSHATPPLPLCQKGGAPAAHPSGPGCASGGATASSIRTQVLVTLGIDTHKHTHLAVALDQLGRRLDELKIPTTTTGFAALYAWASELGTIDTVGIEGTGAYGAVLCRWLRDHGLVVVVVEVERPDRKLRRNAGKSDPIDAEAAARKVLSGEATVTPKSGAGHAEMIRVLAAHPPICGRSRSQVTNQLHALTVTALPRYANSSRVNPSGLSGGTPAYPDALTTRISADVESLLRMFCRQPARSSRAEALGDDVD